LLGRVKQTKVENTKVHKSHKQQQQVYFEKKEMPKKFKKRPKGREKFANKKNN
jgi:hypothetical protein